MRRRTYSRAHHEPNADRATEVLAWLQLGTCGRCGRARYLNRREARRAVRIAAPGERLRAYRCDEAWHLRAAVGHVEKAGSPVVVGRPRTGRRTWLDLAERVERSCGGRRDGRGNGPCNQPRRRPGNHPASNDSD
ncbi:hypothetical protein GCM10010468_76000 [Actinocorallia longicatena]|uniref:Uncharacterized protein n=1 Tax=Actinocorallia longicatena TaxID=111803 RepID=A0ABP6QL86_9ACTN